jgi:hypothetical protein
MESHTDNDAQKEESKNKLKNRPVFNFDIFKMGNKKLIELILALVSIASAHYLDKDVGITILLVVTLVFFHIFLSTKLIFPRLRFLFLLCSIISLTWSSCRFYLVLFPPETPKQETQSLQKLVQPKDTLNIKTETLSQKHKTLKQKIKPYIGWETQQIVPDTIKQTVSFDFKITNINDIPAYHFSHYGAIGNPEPTASDSIDMIQFINRHRYEGYTLSQRSSSYPHISFNCSGLKDTVYLIASFFYIDTNKDNHVTMICFKYLLKSAYLSAYKRFNGEY